MAPLAKAQNIYTGNPADMDLLESTFSNPALNAYLRDRVALALTSHQTGVAGRLFSIRSGLIAYHLPWVLRGTTVGIQYMKAGLYSQDDLRISYGRQVYGALALGANLDVFNRTFDNNEFYQFDPNDPVFRNGYGKSGISIGLGMALNPYHTFVFGLSIEHLNRPDLSIGRGYVPQPVLISTGFKMYFDKFSLFSSASSLAYPSYSDMTISSLPGMLGDNSLFGVEIPVSGYGTLRFSTGARALDFEAEAFVYQGLYFNYRFEYPLTEINVASSGTHRFGFLFDFWRQPPLPTLLPLPSPPGYRSEVIPKTASPRGQFFIYSNADSVTVLTRQVRRSIDESVPHQELSLLFPGDLGGTGGLDVKTPEHLLPEAEVRDPAIAPRGLYSTSYRGALEGIAMDMMRSNVSTEVVTYPGAELRGNALVNQITGSGLSIPKHIPIYTPDSLQLRSAQLESLLGGSDFQRFVRPEIGRWIIVPIFKNHAQGMWRFEVRTSADSTVFSYSGTGEAPDTIRWDWKTWNGDPIPPGTYYVVFQSDDPNGKPEYSTRHYFNVYHVHQTLDIAITRESRIGKINADKYVLILRGKPGKYDAQNPTDPPDVGTHDSEIRKEDLHE